MGIGIPCVVMFFYNTSNMILKFMLVIFQGIYRLIGLSDYQTDWSIN